MEKGNPLMDFWNKQGFYDKAILISALVGIISVFMKWIVLITGISTASGKIAAVMFVGVIAVAFVSKLKEKTKIYIYMGLGLFSFLNVGYTYVAISGTGNGGDIEAFVGMAMAPQLGMYLTILASLAIVGLGVYKLKTLPDFKGFSKKEKIIAGVIIAFVVLGVISPKLMAGYDKLKWKYKELEWERKEAKAEAWDKAHCSLIVSELRTEEAKQSGAKLGYTLVSADGKTFTHSRDYDAYIISKYDQNIPVTYILRSDSGEEITIKGIWGIITETKCID